MAGHFSRRISRRRRRVFVVGGPEQLETRQLLTELSGFVFHDTDDDGNRDSGETGIAGVLVTLTGTTDEGDQVSRQLLTQADGSYTFDNVEPGTYAVTETQPASIADGKESPDVDGMTVGDDQYADIEFTDEAISSLNFGEGLIDVEHISPLWLLASTSRDEIQLEMRATFEEDAGNRDIARAIRSGETEVDTDISINVRPIARDDAYTLETGVDELDVTADDGVLGNDTDPEGSSVTASLNEQASNGTVTLRSDGSFTYVPNSGFSGTDTFSYTANDGFKDSTPATVTITVGDRNTFEVSESALEFDVVGDVEASASVGSDVVYDFADETIAENFRLNPDDNFSGNPEAPVVVIEYLDFACPACFNFHNNIGGDAHQTLRLAPGDYLTVYRYLPLSNFDAFHNEEAARAAEAAGRQGLFVEMLNQLFDTENWNEWRGTEVKSRADVIALFEQYGQEINGFDLDQFRTDFNSQEVIDRVERDRTEAVAEGLAATPTFVLEGERLQSTLTSAQLQTAILEAEQDPFKINHFGTNTATAGQLLVFDSDAITEDDGPFLLQIEARGTDGSEIIDVTVNVTP